MREGERERVVHSKNAFSGAIYVYLHEPSILHLENRLNPLSPQRYYYLSPHCDLAYLQQEPHERLFIGLLYHPLKLQITPTNRADRRENDDCEAW